MSWKRQEALKKRKTPARFLNLPGAVSAYSGTFPSVNGYSLIVFIFEQSILSSSVFVYKTYSFCLLSPLVFSVQPLRTPTQLIEVLAKEKIGGGKTNIRQKKKKIDERS
ncbi:hypothetical protein BY458DRAFT_361768 [Sporodiniella umbellata]|nr:hypothetical protein BY458DRAFT_361768 [Sporodiniella umbellata]